MSNVLFEHPADIVGYSRLAIAAVLGLTDLVETAHQNIALSPGVFGQPAQGATPGITGLVYKTIRGITELVGSGIDTASSPLLWWMNGDVTSTRFIASPSCRPRGPIPQSLGDRSAFVDNL